ncbi:MAG: PEP-CTERM sorting domain-containing protein [Fimbriimonadales bacterium]
MKFSRLAVGAATLCLTGVSLAGGDFYGGDFDGRNGLSITSDAYVFDNFTVAGPGLMVTSVYGNCLSEGNFANMTMFWEVRSGMSVGNGGTLEASGSGTPVVEETGRKGFTYTEYNIRMNGLSFALAAGDYWLGISVDDPAGGKTFSSTTDGTNGIGGPLGDDNSLYGVSSTYIDTETQLGPGVWDFSHGVDGDPVPEPTTLIALGIGFAGVAARRRRS